MNLIPKLKSLGTVLLLVLVLCAETSAQIEEDNLPNTSFDIVINDGRVIDPETELDAVRHVGIRSDAIVAISETPLNGEKVIDADGLVVSPGFIDLHAHGQSYASNVYQAHDGVTTALELEAGVESVARWLNSRNGNALINYGASVSHLASRIRAKGEFREEANILAETTNYAPLRDDELVLMKDVIETELASGGLGIGLLAGYAPGASHAEIRYLFKSAAEFQVPVFVHVPGIGLASIEEMIAHAEATLAPLHIVHINSMALKDISAAIDRVESAQKRGFDITTEMYPYTAASTYLESAMFDEGWQNKFGASYGDIQWQETGERLTEASFREYRQRGGAVIIHMMKEDWIQSGLSRSSTMVASDGMPYFPGAHPRSAGTFSRVLGRYVRENELLGLPEAIAKMTLMPAKRLETVAPDARRKGRLQIGADADITIFDPDAVSDQATFEGGLAYSEGIHYVIVNGTVVIDDGSTVSDVFPGRALRGNYTPD